MNWTIAILTYLFTLIPAINKLLWVGIVLSAIVLVAFIITYLILADSATSSFRSKESREEAKENMKAVPKYIRRSFICGICFFLTQTFFPSQKDVALILGLSIGVEQTQQLIETDRMQRIGGKSLDAIESWLDSVVDKSEVEQE